MAKILKAKYFLFESFTKAHQGFNRSYIGKSLMVGCAILKEGLGWRIGDGGNVDIRG